MNLFITHLLIQRNTAISNEINLFYFLKRKTVLFTFEYYSENYLIQWKQFQWKPFVSIETRLTVHLKKTIVQWQIQNIKFLNYNKEHEMQTLS